LNTKIKKMQMVLAQGLRTTIDEHGVTQGIMMFVVAAVMIAIMLPVLNGVMTASPVLTTDPMMVNNLTSGGVHVAGANATGYGTLTTNAAMVSTQSTMWTTIGSSYGLLVVVLILIAAAVILGAIGLFRYFGGQD
jgi:hypothetical protein